MCYVHGRRVTVVKYLDSAQHVSLSAGDDVRPTLPPHHVHSLLSPHHRPPLLQAFTNAMQTKLDSLRTGVTEYARTGNLDKSHTRIQVLLDKASDLVSFFASNEVVTNGAYQTTVALRLALLLEQLHLEQLLGEMEPTLEFRRTNIRRQASTAKAALESWRANYLPVYNRALYIKDPCPELTSLGIFGGRACRGSDTRKRTASVCMDVRSEGLSTPKPFCFYKECSSKHVNKKIRRKRIDRCLASWRAGVEPQVEKHIRDVGLKEWRDLNEQAVFGSGFRQYLANLAKVEKLDFADVSLPDVDGAP